MKQNKIIVVVNPDEQVRRKIIQRLLVKLSFAVTAVDANKIIKPLVSDFDLSDAYFVCALTHNLRDSQITRQRIYEMAARGILVVVGVKRLQTEYEFICEAVYE